jgi:hypothetical protein
MRKRLWELGGIGAAEAAAWVAVCSLGPLRENTAAFLVLIFVAFGLGLLAFFRFPEGVRHAPALVLGFALLFRLIVLPAPPSQSEDVYRYLWDARIATLGVHPYAYPPDAPELEPYRDETIYPMINSKPYVTAYPPLTQVLFRISWGLFGPSVTGMKAVFALCEFLALVVMWRLLILWGRPLRFLLLAAWNPFFIFEFAHSGHSDSAMMLLILLSVWALARGRKAWAMAGYAAAVLAKLHPALWFPLYWRRAGWKARAAGLGAGIGLLLVYFNVESLGRYLSSLGLYFRLFEFNASVHYLVRFVGRAAFDQSWDKLIGPWLAALLVAVAVGIYLKFPQRDERDLLHAGFWLMTADLCLATTVHPWYLSWAALALPFFPYAFMLYWTAAAFLSYAAYAFHPVHEPAWALLVQYVPMYALMGWEIRRGRPALLR